MIVVAYGMHLKLSHLTFLMTLNFGTLKFNLIYSKLLEIQQVSTKRDKSLFTKFIFIFHLRCVLVTNIRYIIYRYLRVRSITWTVGLGLPGPSVFALKFQREEHTLKVQLKASNCPWRFISSVCQMIIQQIIRLLQDCEINYFK